MLAVMLDEPVRTKLAERRRSRRSSRCVDVTICEAGGAWQEQTCTLSWNEQGILAALGTKVKIGELVLVRDPENCVEREGRVVGLGRGYGRRREVAIEFTEPAPESWLDHRHSGAYS